MRIYPILVALITLTITGVVSRASDVATRLWQASIPLDYGLPGFASAVGLDGSGYVISTGLAPLVPRSSNKRRFYVAKYAPTDGALVWLSHPPSPVDGSRAYSFAVDEEGNAIVLGEVRNVNSAQPELYAAKYSSVSGDLLWETRFGALGTGQNIGLDLKIDPRGDLVCVSRNLNIQAGAFQVAKLAARTGGLVWLHQSGDSPTERIFPIDTTTDSDGHVFVTGYNYESSGDQDSDIVTVKYDATNGAELWRKTRLSVSGEHSHGRRIRADAAGNVGLICFRTGGAYLAKYRGSDGAVLWDRLDTGNADAKSVFVLDVAADGDLFVGTQADGSSSSGMIAMKYDGRDGSLMWKQTAPLPVGASSDGTRAVRVNSVGQVVTLSYEGSVVAYDPTDGRVLWSNQAAQLPTVSGSHLALAPDGGVVVEGRIPSGSGQSAVARYRPSNFAITGVAREVDASSAVLVAQVFAQDQGVQVHFSYGAIADEDFATPRQIIPVGSNGAEVTARIDGLTPHTVYHARVVVTKDGVATPGAPIAFVTGNAIPELLNDRFQTTAGTVSFTAADLLANDRDLDGDSLEVLTISAPLHGTLNSENGVWTYVASASFPGTELLTYWVDDGHLGKVAGQISIRLDLPSVEVLYTSKQVGGDRVPGDPQFRGLNDLSSAGINDRWEIAFVGSSDAYSYPQVLIAKSAIVAKSGRLAPQAPDARLQARSFGSFVSPVIDTDGSVAFISRLNHSIPGGREDRGVYSNLGGSLREVARFNEFVPGEAMRWQTFGNLSIAEGVVFFKARHTGSSHEELWSWTPERGLHRELKVGAGVRRPDGSLARFSALRMLGSSLSSPAQGRHVVVGPNGVRGGALGRFVGGGTVLLIGGYGLGRDLDWQPYLQTGGRLSEDLNDRSLARARWRHFQSPAWSLDGQNLAFAAGWVGASDKAPRREQEGLFLYRAGIGLERCVTAGDLAPGAGEARFGSFLNPLAGGEEFLLAFAARLQGEGIDRYNDDGIWFRGPAGLQLLARQGDIAPGGDSLEQRFLAFESFILGTSNGPFFTASLTKNWSNGYKRGLWGYSAARGLELYLREGGTLGGKTIASFVALADSTGATSSFTSSGDAILALVTFSDRTKSIVRIVPPFLDDAP